MIIRINYPSTKQEAIRNIAQAFKDAGMVSAYNDIAAVAPRFYDKGAVLRLAHRYAEIEYIDRVEKKILSLGYGPADTSPNVFWTEARHELDLDANEKYDLLITVIKDLAGGYPEQWRLLKIIMPLIQK